MNALMCPIEPRTTMSTPFIEMPQRAAASPCTTTIPPRPVAPADWLAFPSTTTVPDMMFSATPVPALPRTRSEEHTSELQSHLNLVCRLLLEKKKKFRPPTQATIADKTRAKTTK